MPASLCFGEGPLSGSGHCFLTVFLHGGEGTTELSGELVPFMKAICS